MQTDIKYLFLSTKKLFVEVYVNKIYQKSQNYRDSKYATTNY
jgi:hypothetical protein